MFETLLLLASVVAGAIASVAGFGVGSVLTPVFALRVDTRLAVALELIFGGLLLLAGLGELTGLARRIRLRGKAAWVAGALSGVCGGLVGNQGGIRSAALLGFDVPRDAFVATATAIALAIDLARLPVYVIIEREGLARVAGLVALATAGAVAGTLVGQRLLARIPESVFRRVVAVLLLTLAVYMIGRG